MEAVRDLLDSVRAFLRYRLANPLYLSYLVAWAVLNFRLLLVLFGDDGWQRKITYIDTALYPKAWHWAWFGFGYPLLVAIAFVLLSPFVHRWVTLFLKEREKTTIAALLKVAGETPLPPEAADALRAQLLDIRRAATEERRKATDQINELNAQIELLQGRAPKVEVSQPAIKDEEAAKRETERLLEIAADPFLDIGPHGQEQRSSGQTYELFERDFPNEAADVVRPLLDSGLSIAHALVLAKARNGEPFTAPGILAAFGWKPEAIPKLLTQMLALQLIEETPVRGQYRLTAIGRLALNGAIRRGFDPRTFKLA